MPGTDEVSWIDDPKLARKLARLTWLVLVAAFVLLTRFSVDAAAQRGVLAALLAVVAVLNAPVVVGLRRSREHAHTAAFRAVALALAMRFAATAGVVWYLSS